MRAQRRQMVSAAVAIAATLSLMAPSGAQAAPGRPPLAPGQDATVTAPAVPTEVVNAAATTLPESTEVEKVRAVRALFGEATDDWLVLSDKNFVFRVHDRADAVKYPLTKAEAYRVYRTVVDDPAAPDATAFIRTGIHAFVDRDQIEHAHRVRAEREAREARQTAAVFAEIPTDAAMLDGTDQNFVYQVWRRSTGPKVKEGAAQAWGGDAAAWKTFITTTIRTLHLQDQADAIAKAREESEEAARLLAARQAKKNAASVLAVVAPEGWLTLSDDNFIRQLLTTPEIAQPRRAEVAAAAEAALRDSSPAAWAAFIGTGIFAADQRDAARERAVREEADRQQVREIKTRAEASRLRPRLVAAADAALAAGPAAVTEFLTTTQHTVLEQALMSSTAGTKGWHVRSGGGDAWITPGTSGPAADAPLGEATWKVVAGLADAACYSLESSTHAGSYLRQENHRVKLGANDGGDQFKRDATWCPKAGLTGSGVSLESKANPGRYLRHFNAALYTANGSGQFVWDANTHTYEPDSTWTVVGPNPLISTSIMLRWHNDDAWRAFVGNPTTAEVLDGAVRYRDFANARAYWTEAHGVHDVWGPILARYLEGGGHNWRLPITDSTGTPASPGAFNHFSDGGSIYWSEATGAHQVWGAIRSHWEALGWERSYLGFPTSSEFQVGNLRRSTFQHGGIDHNPVTKQTWDYRY
ncbi:AbfB domain-containing protein [Actinokineospora sp. G85]|uniref:AbfB domain-containing protein n=1 Tax=Actinokineospora sp. G85 TaxID=3406626 RepID=UPI003C72B3E2